MANMIKIKQIISAIMINRKHLRLSWRKQCMMTLVCIVIKTFEKQPDLAYSPKVHSMMGIHPDDILVQILHTPLEAVEMMD